MAESYVKKAAVFLATAFFVSPGFADEQNQSKRQKAPATRPCEEEGAKAGENCSGPGRLLERSVAETNNSADDHPKQAGIGVALAIEDGNFIIYKVVPDTPAARNGSLKPNDRIVAVAEGDGEPVELTGMKMKAAVGMIRGPEGSLVRLTIIPVGESEEDAQVVSLRRGSFSELNTFVDGSLLPCDSAAPNFMFQRLSDSEELAMSDFTGRVVVLDFWASWCGPCIKALDELQALKSEHPEWEGKVELLAVSVDEKKENAIRIAKDKEWPGISVVWAGPDLLRTYRVGSLPTVFVIDEQGKVAAADNRIDIPEVVKSLLQEK